MPMLRSTKLAALRASQFVGASRMLGGSPWRSARLLVLGYHGIAASDESSWDPLLYLRPEVFRRRLELIRETRSIVLPLDEALVRLKAGSLPPRAVVLTFDDGTLDFATHAVPMLQEFGFPATLYLTTYYSDLQRPVFDTMCRYLLWRGRDRKIDRCNLGLPPATVDLADPTVRLALFLDMRRRARELGLSGEEKDGELARLAQLVKVDYDEILRSRKLCIVSPDEVAKLPSPLVSVQLHTHRHRTPLDREQFAREIRDNREWIQRVRGNERLVHFCYPSGRTDPRFVPWLRELGVQSATTCEPAIMSARKEMLLTPRLLDMSSMADVEFASWLDGTASLLPQRAVATPILD